MEYTTFEFYKTSYFGERLDEDNFEKWTSKAVDRINYITNGGVTDENMILYSERMQKSICAAADVLYDIDVAYKDSQTAVNDSNIKSISSGGESVSYEKRETIVSKALADNEAQNRMIYDAIRIYLYGTGVLYLGM